MDLLTYPIVEEAIKKRVETKAKTYGQVVDVKDSPEPVYKINPSLVADLYGDWIMPLTKQVQVEYLLRRLDWTMEFKVFYTINVMVLLEVSIHMISVVYCVL